MRRRLNFLTPEQIAVIAEAVLADPRCNCSDIARKVGAHRVNVFRTVAKIREAGGWYTPLTWTECTECGHPVYSRPGKHPRAYHRECRSAHYARYAREHYSVAARSAQLEGCDQEDRSEFTE